MNNYAILRRSGWKSAGDLEEAAGRSRKVGDEEMSDDIRWIRSYVLEEGGGSDGIDAGTRGPARRRSKSRPRSPSSPRTRSSRWPTPRRSGPIRRVSAASTNPAYPGLSGPPSFKVGRSIPRSPSEAA